MIDGIRYFIKTDDTYTEVPDGQEFNAELTYYIQIPGIQTLEQYFCHLKDLLDLPNGYKYIMLPLDEPPLEIDANKRTITIPSNFKTSGLSVEGDELAETLFFRIDRYFDAMDLSTCEIFVQWNLPTGDTYATIVYMIDIESEPGKLIFACPLTSDITKVAGPVELSVRFIKRGANDTFAYSFNTLAVRANISAALKINGDIHYIGSQDVQDLFTAAIENSDMASGEPAPAPVFTKWLGSDNNIATVDKIYLNGENNKLTIAATSEPAGELTYEWYHTPNGSSWAKKVQSNESNEFTIAMADDLVDIESTDYSTKTATGVYQVRAINRLNNKTAKAWSDKVELPAPVKPNLVALTDKIIENIDEGVELEIAEVEGAHQDNAAYNYEWIYTAPDTTEASKLDTEVSAITATQAGYYQAKVSAAQNGDIAYAQSNKIRVTNLPEAIIFGTEDAKEAAGETIKTKTIVYTTTDSYTPTVTEPDMQDKDKQFISDQIYYTWIQDVKDAEGNYNGVLKADGTIDFDNAKILVPGYTVAEDGTYVYNTSPKLDFVVYGSVIASLGSAIGVRCVATNVLNNKEINTESLVYVFI